MNISFLAKWRWRLIEEENNLWKLVIRSKYGEEVDKNVNLGVDCILWFASNWWKDICSIGSNWNYNRFVLVSRKVGNGNTTRFWMDKWVGEEPLKDKFPCLLSISNRKEAWVSDMKVLDMGVCS
jgi:hypothetical protein